MVGVSVAFVSLMLWSVGMEFKERHVFRRLVSAGEAGILAACVILYFGTGLYRL